MYKKCLIWLLSFYQGRSYILEERKASIPHKSEVPLQTPHRLSLSHERWIWLFGMVMFWGWVIESLCRMNLCVCIPPRAATLDKCCSESQFPLGTDIVCNHCSWQGAEGRGLAVQPGAIPVFHTVNVLAPPPFYSTFPQNS